MPIRNCTSTLPPGDIGRTRLTFGAESEELKPPPLGCCGGCSRVVPCTVTVEPSVRLTTTDPDVRGRKSAVPEGAGNVSISATRNRSRVTFAPVLFTHVRLIEIVPKVELFAGSEVNSRATFGGALSACAGSKGA